MSRNFSQKCASAHNFDHNVEKRAIQMQILQEVRFQKRKWSTTTPAIQYDMHRKVQNRRPKFHSP